MSNLVFATCDELPELDAGDRAVVAELRRLGHRARAAIWNDAREDWAAADAVIVRSCWDYHLEVDRFLGWLDQLDAMGVGVGNPTPVLRWNLDKRYLLELAAQGTDVVPTHLVAPRTEWDLPAILEARGWQDAVIKPAISLSAHRTWRCTPANAAEVQQKFEAGQGGSGALIQPFIPEIAREGEWSLIYFAGRYSHAARKLPAAGDFRVQTEHGGSRQATEPPPEVRESSDALVARRARDCLYARVDGVRWEGVWHLMELELIDPELYVDRDAAAAARFAAAVAAAFS
ncbi:MAG: hypothetical protein AAF628_05580 [Planctomycetota bacterium]